MAPETDPHHVEEVTAHTPGDLTQTFDGWLPSRPASVPVPERTTPADPLSLEVGGRICEFVIERVLGRGGFGVVYLARQLSLDRQVALKVVPRSAGEAAAHEGKSLARLEHEHIVAVYAEMSEPISGARLLCMQYVAGTTLAAVIRELKGLSGGQWTGADLLAVLDALDLPPVLFEPSAMRDRDFLVGADHVEAVCRIGEQLSLALAHAHSCGVLHRDVKPANVLINRYGRPLLADFNLATQGTEASDSSLIGGTLAYMAPEHLDAFRSPGTASHPPVDARADIYSLSVLLWELSSGSLPFPVATGPIDRNQLSETLNRLAICRRTQPPLAPPNDRRLKNVLLKGLAPNLEDRCASASEFAQSLAGLREQRSALRALPEPDRITRWAWNHPVSALVIGALLPQIFGSILQISYNALRIVDNLTPAQSDLFPLVVLIYNLVAYPACLTWLGHRGLRVLRVWNRLRREEPVTDAEVELARRRVIGLPRATAIAACVGWLPGGILFPLTLHLFEGPITANTAWHFFVSFALAGLIAVTYSYFFGMGLVLRTIYPRFWSSPTAFQAKAEEELAAVPNQLRRVNVMAGIIPLAGAVMMILVTPIGFTDHTYEYNAFRFLTTSLIVAGMAGYAAVGRLTHRYLEVVSACTGTEYRRKRRWHKT